MIIQIGDHQWNVNFGYNALEWTRSYTWAGVPILGNYPNLQFTAKSREIAFSGAYWNYVADADAPADIEAIADEAKPMGMTDDLGNFYGYWVIVSITKSEEHFRPGQKTGLRTEFDVRMRYYGEEAE